MTSFKAKDGVHSVTYNIVRLHVFIHVKKAVVVGQTSQWSLDSSCFELGSSHQQEIQLVWPTYTERTCI